jgi:hypothetical protein
MLSLLLPYLNGRDGTERKEGRGEGGKEGRNKASV